MRIVHIDVGKGQSGILIGRRGETEATRVIFDISSLIETYGAGECVLLAKLPGASTAYPVVVEQDGEAVTWTVSDADTSVQGAGECELFYYVGETLAKSYVWPTIINRDIGTEGDPPDPYETWLDTLTGLAADTRQNADDAQAAADAAEAALAEFTGATATAETLPAGSEATADYRDGLFTFGIPRGETGPQGEAGETPVRGVDYWTNADKAEIVADVLAALPSAVGVVF